MIISLYLGDDRMSRTYSDYYTKTAITLPDQYIDVKTGESSSVGVRIQEEIEYHAKNNTLIHLVLSALNHYLYPKQVNDGGNKEILSELTEIKRMIAHNYQAGHNPSAVSETPKNRKHSLDLKDLEELLEAFGG